ncbi:hypothetical protein HDU84_000503 [Entophlyctis sp. JEL0112]|nr:hypothetical protein HDU84_000503 [Entophlyctis sp. JEL0112]
MNHATPFVSPRSQVLLNEIRLKETFEKYSKTPHKIRTREVFAVLDEIIPQLGVFGPLVTIIKDELFQSVFSKTLTSCEVEPFVERVPFFSIAGRVDEARHVTGLVSEEAEKANDSLAELQQRVRFRDHDLQILYKKNMALKQDITDYQLKQETLLSKIKALEDQCHKYELEKGESAYYYSAKEDSLKHEIEKLQTTLAQKNAIIDKLTVFKTAYNDASSSALDEIEKNKTELIVDSIGMVEYDIYQAERLQEQFAEILNYQMDDFELALSQLRKKKEILVGVVINETERDASYMLELHELVVAFRKRITDLLDEQKLLKGHTVNLKTIFENYKTDTKTVKRVADVGQKCYSSVLQLSEDGGESFKTYKHVGYCGKCGDWTLLCPHKSGSMDAIALKHNTTHVRLIRPGLKLRTLMTADKNKKLVSVFQGDDSDDLEGEDEFITVSKTMKQCWAEYYDSRRGFRPKCTRVFKLDRTLDYIQEVYEARIAYEEKIDDIASKDDATQYMKFSDFFYDFFQQRYQIQEVALKGCHDLLTAMSKFEAENLDVAIFIRHLCSLEVVTWKYISDARRLFARFNDGQPFSTAKYRQILSILYPCRPRELYDQMELEFTAFSKNKFTLEMLDEHLLHMIFKQIEPNVKFFSLCLKKFDYQETGILQFEDFEEAITSLMPSILAKHKRLYYRLAEQDFSRDAVPISSLAMICSYFVIHESSLHSWLPQTINAPEVIAQLSKILDSRGDGANASRGSGAATASDGIEERVTQKDVDIILKTDNVHGINLDAKAVEEEEAKMKMVCLNLKFSPHTFTRLFPQRIDMAMAMKKGKGLRSDSDSD